MGRSRSTIRKWRAEIEKLSGYHFKKIRVSAHQYDFDFSQEELQKFISLVNVLDNKGTLHEAITQSFGNQALKKRKEKNDTLKQLQLTVQSQSETLRSLQTQLTSLHQKVSALIEQVATFENKKWFKSRK